MVVVTMIGEPPTVNRPVNSTSAGFTVVGTAKNSLVVTAWPNGVVTAIVPDAVALGALTLSCVAVGLVASSTTCASRPAISTLSSSALLRKLVPVTVMTVPAVPTCGAKPAIVGADELVVTTKSAVL